MVAIVPLVTFLFTVSYQFAGAFECKGLALATTASTMPFFLSLVNIDIFDERQLVGPHSLKNKSKT